MSKLLVLAGALLIIAGGIILFPLISEAWQPLPSTFGETLPPLRPTVTPLFIAGQAAVAVPPARLPDTPRLAPNQSAPPLNPTLPISTVLPLNRPTRLIIPAINLDAPIETVGWSEANGVNLWDIPNHFAAGWLKTSAPLGSPGNTVLDGHHNLAGEVFRRLVDLKAGDVIEVQSNWHVFKYEVVALHILPDRDQPIEIRRHNAMWIQPTVDERLTLVTCWPYTNNTHRLIVVAKPIGPA
jgi:LPXTG-site transpeptidase (sortase) family protein